VRAILQREYGRELQDAGRLGLPIDETMISRIESAIGLSSTADAVARCVVFMLMLPFPP